MASITRQVRGEAQKGIAKSFESLCGRHGRWEVWADWITLSACSISNAVDISHREQREKTYRTVQEKYTPEELSVMGEMFGMLVLSFDENPDQDILGDLYMNLNLGNEHIGQFFTPYTICRLMASMNIGNIKAEVEERGWIGVSDPTCGAGAMLVAFANECLRHDVNYQMNVLIAAQDIDFVVGMMCYIQLSLIGCAGYVVIGDTLLHPTTAIDRRGLIPKDEGNVWYTPLYFHNIWHWRRSWVQVELMCMFKKSNRIPQPERQAPKKPERPTETQKMIFSENKNGQLTLF